MPSVADHFDTVFFTACKKMPRYSRELVKQLADRFTALYYFHSAFVHGVVKLSFSNKFFFDLWLPYYPRAAVTLNKLECFHVVYCPGFPRKMTAWLLSKHFVSFSGAFILGIFVQIPSFSFQLWALVIKTLFSVARNREVD